MEIIVKKVYNIREEREHPERLKGKIKMKKIYQQTLTCVFEERNDGVEHTWKTSFGTFEKAKEDTEKLINKTESWMKATVLRAQIINRETNEILYTYNV